MAATNFSGPVVSTGGFTGDVTGNVTGGVSATFLNVVVDTAAAIADETSSVNTTNKSLGSVVFDSTNNKLYIATGGGATDDWALADGSATVTPS